MPIQHSDKRSYPRLIISLPVDAVIGDRVVQSFTRDISSSGLFINTAIRFRAGEKACLVFSIPGQDRDKPLKINGKSVRAGDRGIGIQFQGLSPYFVLMLDEAIRNCRISSARP